MSTFAKRFCRVMLCGILLFTCYLLATMTSPIVAQNERTELGDISCKSITLTGPDGNLMLIDDASITILDHKANPRIFLSVVTPSMASTFTNLSVGTPLIQIFGEGCITGLTDGIIKMTRKQNGVKTNGILLMVTSNGGWIDTYNQFGTFVDGLPSQSKR